MEKKKEQEVHTERERERERLGIVPNCLTSEEKKTCSTLGTENTKKYPVIFVSSLSNIQKKRKRKKEKRKRKRTFGNLNVRPLNFVPWFVTF